MKVSVTGTSVSAPAQCLGLLCDVDRGRISLGRTRSYVESAGSSPHGPLGGTGEQRFGAVTVRLASAADSDEALGLITLARASTISNSRLRSRAFEMLTHARPRHSAIACSDREPQPSGIRAHAAGDYQRIEVAERSGRTRTAVPSRIGQCSTIGSPAASGFACRRSALRPAPHRYTVSLATHCVVQAPLAHERYPHAALVGPQPARTDASAASRRSGRGQASDAPWLIHDASIVPSDVELSRSRGSYPSARVYLSATACAIPCAARNAGLFIATIWHRHRKRAVHQLASVPSRGKLFNPHAPECLHPRPGSPVEPASIQPEVTLHPAPKPDFAGTVMRVSQPLFERRTIRF